MKTFKVSYSDNSTIECDKLEKKLKGLESDIHFYVSQKNKFTNSGRGMAEIVSDKIKNDIKAIEKEGPYNLKETQALDELRRLFHFYTK